LICTLIMLLAIKFNLSWKSLPKSPKRFLLNDSLLFGILLKGEKKGVAEGNTFFLSLQQ